MWALVLGRGGFEPPKALGQLIYSQSRLTTSVSARPGDFTDNDSMANRRWVLWQGLISASMERFILSASAEGFEFNGLILQAHQDAPYVARYAIRIDPAWRTRGVEVELENGGRTSLNLSSDGAGRWTRAGEALDALDGCHDVDLEWSPSTNTLPIRRLALVPGESKAVSAAWVRFPSLAVERLEQTYERLDDRRFRYRSGRFAAELLVDDDGLVSQYGFNWKAVAASGAMASTPAGPATGKDRWLGREGKGPPR
jgi:uncharacterized protein